MADLDRPIADATPPYPRSFFENVTHCQGCGCHDFDACVEDDTGMVCWWVEENLCSACAAKMAAQADPAMADLYVEDPQ